MFPYDGIELNNKERLKFKVNSQRVKHYMGEKEDFNFLSEVELVEV